MAYSGRISFLSIPGGQLTNATGQAVAQALPDSVGPLLSGSVNQLAGAAAETVLNVGLSSLLGPATSKQFGIPLNAGQNFLQSQVTPFLTSTLAQGVNLSITDSLKGAGPLAPILGNLAGQVVSGLGQSLLDGLNLGGNNAGGAGAGAGGGSSRAYPGAGGEGEGEADYGDGGAYSLGTGGPDVVFSIRPASSPAQIEAAASANDAPTTDVKVPTEQFTKDIPDKVYNAAPISNETVETAFKVPAIGESTVSNAEAKVAAQTFQTTEGGTNIGAATQGLVRGEFTGTEAQKSFLDKLAQGTAYGQPIDTTATDDSSDSPETAWKFIVAPENIEWSTSADVNRIPIFGSNQNPVVVGAKGMRDLELGNALVEGFTRGVTVEGKVQALEDLLNYSLNTGKGYVNVPVYQVTANDKQYGAGKNSTDGGYFLIKEVRVKETMRDLSGKTTRASVDISFTQIPPYQVDGGRDQATNVTQKAAKQLLLQSISEKLEKLEQITPTTSSGPGSATPQAPNRTPGQRGGGSPLPADFKPIDLLQ
jgi:hypothetical protein